jgi:signal transduction histidine kinase
MMEIGGGAQQWLLHLSLGPPRWLAPYRRGVRLPIEEPDGIVKLKGMTTARGWAEVRRPLESAVRSPLLWLVVALVVALVSGWPASARPAGRAGPYVVAVGLLGAALGVVVLACRRTWQNLPWLAVVAVSGAVAAAPDLAGLVLLVPVVAVALIGSTAPWPVAAGWTAGVCGVLAGVHQVVAVPGQSTVRYATLPVLGLAFGIVRRQRQERLETAERLLAETQRANAEQARAAALAERSRLAREIHDVLAHTLGAVVTQLGAAEATLDADAPEAGRHHVRQARRLAAEGLQDARRAVATLRGVDPPLPDLLRVLADRHHPSRDGQVDVEISGTIRTLPPEASLALYRAAQEALANAGKYAPGRPVRLALHYDSAAVELVVTNPLPEPAQSDADGGYGLIGMRERAALLGGQVSAGRVGDQWAVRLRLPLPTAP